VTAIEWTDETWNPTVGCSRVSPGCDHCYAIGVAHRAMQPAHEGLTIRRPGERPDWTGEVRCLPDRLDTPLRWRKPRRVFVDSMSDLFHRDVPSHFIGSVFRTMARCPRHTFQVLTKRPQRMEAWVQANNEITVPTLPNVWLGTSIESDRYTFRADHLRVTPAAVRFLSLEPLLGPLPSLDLTGIDWVIVGGESGPGARPMHPDWVRDLRDRCVDAGVAFFFKQWGTWAEGGDGVTYGRWVHPETGATNGARPHQRAVLMTQVGKKAAGRELDGRTWDEMPEARRA
jgi:protein gp37